ncbi:MAG TPA: DUF6677 family protein [Candidatus Acidoferrum sp.]|nr:DUF6677 family protein [Candidatus Acidoferrum sp.]
MPDEIPDLTPPAPEIPSEHVPVPDPGPEFTLENIAPTIEEQQIPAPPRRRPSRVARLLVIVYASWLIPGLGHLVQRRWGRAIIGFLAVGTMALAGMWMRGNVFPPQRGDAFGVLGFIADAGAGIFYLLSDLIQKTGGDVSHAAGDYGTRVIATAGVLNLLFVLDALEVSRGKKN